MVMPEALETPEQGLGVEAPERDLDLAGREQPEALADRIVELRGSLPDSQGVACRACFRRGAKAVLEALDTKRSDIREQIAALWTTYPHDDAPHQAASYRAGVEAALRALRE